MTTNPTVAIIAPADITDALRAVPAAWSITGAFTHTDAFWDATDDGSLPADLDVVLAWAGCDGAGTDVPGTVVSYAPHTRVWLFTAEQNVDALKSALRTYQEQLNIPVNLDALPVVQVTPETLQDVLAQELRDIVTFPTQDAPDTSDPALSGPVRPSLASLEPSVAASTTDSGEESYAQATVYSREVSRNAGQIFTKLPTARPGQMTIACMSSKGGSGKSTTALSLAGMIAQGSKAAGDPKKVVVVDLDVRDGQVGSLIGQYLPTAVSIRIQPTWDAATVTENLVHDPRLGIDALLAPVRPRNAEDVGPDFYRQVIQVLQTTHDVVILDCSVSYLDPLLGMAFALSDEILFVTTLATTSIQGMARALGEMFAPVEEGGLAIPPAKVGIVANQVMANVGITKDQIFSAALGSQIVGTIPAAFNEVLVATNANRLDKLLRHPQLGAAYYSLARKCLPGATLSPLVEQK